MNAGHIAILIAVAIVLLAIIAVRKDAGSAEVVSYGGSEGDDDQPPDRSTNVLITIHAQGHDMAPAYIEAYRIEEAMVEGGVVPEGALVVYQALPSGTVVRISYSQDRNAG